MQKFLAELEALGLVTRMGDEYLRVDTRNVDAVARPVHGECVETAMLCSLIAFLRQIGYFKSC